MAKIRLLLGVAAGLAVIGFAGYFLVSVFWPFEFWMTGIYLLGASVAFICAGVASYITVTAFDYLLLKIQALAYNLRRKLRLFLRGAECGRELKRVYHLEKRLFQKLPADFDRRCRAFRLIVSYMQQKRLRRRQFWQRLLQRFGICSPPLTMGGENRKQRAPRAEDSDEGEEIFGPAL